MDSIVITGAGSLPLKKEPYHIRKVLRPGVKLYLGTECNDGRPITESIRYKEAVKKGIPIIRKAPTIVIEKDKKEPFVTKYAPKTVRDIIGHKESIQQLTNWLTSWPSQQKGVLITGPPGIGKTTTVHLIAQALGYSITEYNASDTRSVSMLRGLLGLGMKRLRKEVIVMDEVDGFTGQERGGVGELAELIRKSNVPFLCIANHLVPKLAPLQKACLVIKFSRPVKSTIANALLNVCKAEDISLTKVELETLCEKNGNDIRAILNQLEFGAGSSDKDANLKLDLFSATQKLLGNKRLSMTQAEDLVFVDYGMVPLMVQEGYLAASRNSLEDAVEAAEMISTGDLINRRLWQTQDWTLLPHVVHSTVAVARSVSGPCPFQIFPQVLGKNSKKMKHRRLMEDVARSRQISAKSARLDEAESIQKIILHPLRQLKGEKADLPKIKEAVGRMDAIGLSRDQIIESLGEVSTSVDLPTKVKTALTREYNKGHAKKRKIIDPEDDLEDLEEEMEELDLD